jgi:hypothetical protein
VILQRFLVGFSTTAAAAAKTTGLTEEIDGWVEKNAAFGLSPRLRQKSSERMTFGRSTSEWTEEQSQTFSEKGTEDAPGFFPDGAVAVSGGKPRVLAIEMDTINTGLTSQDIRMGHELHTTGEGSSSPLTRAYMPSLGAGRAKA